MRPAAFHAQRHGFFALLGVENGIVFAGNKAKEGGIHAFFASADQWASGGQHLRADRPGLYLSLIHIYGVDTF